MPQGQYLLDEDYVCPECPQRRAQPAARLHLVPGSSQVAAAPPYEQLRALGLLNEDGSPAR